ncbi:MAG TPA: AdeC/AdeK/OprM family multidrug efflux complex outer membrane factor [Burkholderiaceae bacterium]|nr:AdeC/AdeK/OprM family multidrug efflux complex outer membrane factor [Burkholderiaceae bacterium]
MKRLFLGPLAAALFLAGCASLAPDYERPAMPVGSNWPQGPAYRAMDTSAVGTPAADITWQQFIIDDRLRQVVETALNNNRDLRVALLNIERARAQYGVQRAETLPSIGVSGSGAAQRVPADLSPTGQEGITRQYSAGVGISAYELDLFGRVRSLKDEALQRYLATQEAHKTVHIALVAEVANAWLSLAADQERLDLARRTLDSQQQSYALTRRSQELGAASMLDLRQAQTLVESARVDVARFTSHIAQDRNALELLVGSRLPDSLLPAGQGDGAATLSELRASLPSDVLQSRPDVVRAERLLQAANANIGAARAAFFPRIALTASAGTASNALGSLFDGGTGFWSFLPQLDLPIFDGGRNRANLKISEADRDIALAEYEKSVQVAFREVADALAERGTLGEQLDAQRDLVDASEHNKALADARYRSGVDSYLNVLDAQRNLYAAQQELITLRLANSSNHVALYKALGGGWKSGPETL